MKKNPISLIILLAGVGIIITGIVMTVIPLLNFNVFTYNLGRSIVYAFVFSFVGIVLIILSIMYNSKRILDSTNKTIDTIAENVKETILKEKEINKIRKCEYCGNKIKAGSNKCNNCGATIQNNEKM